jgi:hypothetical protein
MDAAAQIDYSCSHTAMPRHSRELSGSGLGASRPCLAGRASTLRTRTQWLSARTRLPPAPPHRRRRASAPVRRRWASAAPAAMGVGGLIPLFVDLMGRLDLLTGNGNTKKNLYALCKGKVVGVDGNCLLHRLASIPSIAHPIVFGGDYSEAAKLFCLWCQQMLDGGISLRMVFDGAVTPGKRAEKKGRTDAAAKARGVVEAAGSDADFSDGYIVLKN